MKHIGLLENVMQEYAWGSPTAIPELLGKPAPSSGRPQAEMWMGAHPKAPSLVKTGKGKIPLNTLIEDYPVDILGHTVADKFSKKFPFLFKVLAAAKPLSIQAHPSKLQAEQGFERENRLGIPLDADYRNYKDNNHKPECICALTDFHALYGFRHISDMLQLLEKILPKPLAGLVGNIKQRPDSIGLKIFFSQLLTLPEEVRNAAVAEAVKNATPFANQVSEFQWMITLFKEYGNDIGIFAPVIMNLTCLKPGEAMFLNAGDLHAYLEGVGIELMANSDNVLRGGLTPKHVDAEELLKVLNFEPKAPEILMPVKAGECEQVYPADTTEFALSVIYIKKGQVYESRENRGPEILLCTNGKLRITEMPETGQITFLKGTSVIIPASVGKYIIDGDGVLYKASVPVSADI